MWDDGEGLLGQEEAGGDRFEVVKASEVRRGSVKILRTVGGHVMA